MKGKEEEAQKVVDGKVNIKPDSKVAEENSQWIEKEGEQISESSSRKFISLQEKIMNHGRRMIEIQKLGKKQPKIGRGELGRIQIAYYTFFKQNSHINDPVAYYTLKKKELIGKMAVPK